ncbi:MAG TPA: HdeD family acid-resistance protein [Actinomycetota bacterium]|nr:HdeD family acid-resistance protein [Actinomycetota bacterium]
MSQRMQADWRWIAVRAVAAFIFGLLALLLPGITLGALVILFGAFALVDGVFTLVAAFTQGRGGWNTVAWLLAGALGVGVGIVTFFWPGITALALLYVIAAWALVTGAFEIAAAISLRREINHEWLLVLSGLLSIVLAAILVFAPGAGALGITWAIGWYALLASGVLAAQAWRLKQRRQHAPSFTPGTAPSR